jgi:hypothetical protein
VDLSDYCAKNNVPLDFLSTHSYPTDKQVPGAHSGSVKQADTENQFLTMQFAAKQAEQAGKCLVDVLSGSV